MLAKALGGQATGGAIRALAASTPLLLRALNGITAQGAFGWSRDYSAAGSGGKGLCEEKRAPATGGAEAKYEAKASARDLFDLTGSTAFITGGAQGIGAAIAVGFASCGADVALADIANEGRMTAVAEHIRSLGRRAATVQCDVRDRGAVDVAVRQAAEALGQGPDILIASAGIIGQLEAAQDVSHSGWKEVIETNLEGSYNAARSCYPYMKQRGRGKVVFISSIAGARGAGAQVAYACSKGALLPLSNSLAAAWGKDNITVNTLLPGAVNTQMLNVMVQTPEMLAYLLSRIPLGRLGVANDLVGPALFLASHASDYVTGTYFPVDGGGLCLPMLPFQQPEEYKA